MASGYAGLIQTSLGNQYTEACTLVLAAANLVAPSTCTVGACFAADFASWCVRFLWAVNTQVTIF